jgi:hypothetical protein
VATKENCSAEQLAELEKLLETPTAELEAELEELKAQLTDAQTTHDELLKSLEQQYEDSEEAIGKLKKELGPRLKLLRAATAKPADEGNANKDEV